MILIEIKKTHTERKKYQNIKTEKAATPKSKSIPFP